MFLVRTIFWLSIVVALIPVNPADLGEGQRPVSTMETLGAAQTVIHDLTGFCERNPQACNTGNELFAQFGAKARTGARYVSVWFEKAGADAQPTNAKSDDIQQADPVATGAVTQ